MDTERFDGQAQLDQLGVQPHKAGHPVVTGIAWAFSVIVVRHYARAYLERTGSPRKAAAFFHRADNRLWLGIAALALAIMLGVITSYVSLRLADLLFAIGVITILALIVPPGIRMFSYAAREVTYRRQAHGSAASRLLQ